jgi:N-formylglutamate deformylase
LVEETLAGMGYRIRRNDPYAGGYVTRHYGRPRDGVHALQVEIARGLYMDEARVERAPGMAMLERDIRRMIATLARTDWSFLR